MIPSDVWIVIDGWKKSHIQQAWQTERFARTKRLKDLSHYLKRAQVNSEEPSEEQLNDKIDALRALL